MKFQVVNEKTEQTRRIFVLKGFDMPSYRGMYQDLVSKWKWQLM